MSSHEQLPLDAAQFDHAVAIDSPEGPCSNAETCPNGYERCDGPDGDELPCFACYEPDSFEEEA